MTKTIEAIYEHGLLRPEEPLEVAEQTRVRVTIEIDAAEEHKEQAVKATRNPFIGSVQGAEPGAPIAREHDRWLNR